MSEVLESLFVLGTSHHATPLEVRERFALTQSQALDLQKLLHQHEAIRECLVPVSYTHLTLPTTTIV